MGTGISPSTPWSSLYRSLLRECSYLPDPIAREYMHSYVRSSFRAGRAMAFAPRRDLPHHLLHRRARRLASLLHRANEGYLKPLERVLFRSYGRSGKRRRELVEAMLWTETSQPEEQPQHASSSSSSSDSVIDSKTNTNTQKKLHRMRPDFHSDDFAAPKPIMDLLKSQLQKREVRDSGLRLMPKDLTPPIPDLNSWGRPMPQRRKVNIRRRWYARVLDAVFPFLPERDLDVLRGVADGSRPLRPPPRRTRVGVHPAPAPDPDPQTTETALTSDFLIHGAPKGPTFARYARGRPHRYSLRLVRRIWSKVYMVVPRMEWNERLKTWHVAWGPKKSHHSIFYETGPQAAARSLFDGLDTKGKKIKPTKKKKKSDANHGNLAEPVGEAVDKPPD